MSGQSLQRLDPTPGQHSAIGSDAPAPSVRTATYQATAARYTNDGRGMAALGSALSSFFDAGARAVETVAQVQHREEMVQTRRENEALAKQGIADQKLGKDIDPAHADRRDYFEAYQTSAADAQAHRLSEGLREHLAAQPLDGSVDLTKTAEDFYRAQVGNGSGDPAYDARLLSQFSRAAESQVSQFNEARRTTVVQNTTQAVVEQFTQRVLSPEGISTPQFAELRDRLLPLVHGNTANRDKLMMAAIAGAVQNDGQGISVLRSMQDLGLDQTEPETFNRISGEVLKRTNQIKTFDAGQAVERFHMDMALEKGKYPQGILPPEKVAEFAQRAFGIDSVHGVGMDVFGLRAEWSRGVEKAADENLWDAAYDGRYGTHEAANVASLRGKPASEVMSKHYDSAVSRRLVQASPALAATVDGTGIVNPMANDAAAQDYGRFILAGGPNAGHRAASQDTISENFRNKMGGPLIGRDPNAIVRSFSFYDLLAGGMTREQLHRYFPGEEAENRYYAIKSVAQGPEGLRQLAQTLADNPLDAKLLGDAFKTGKANISQVVRSFGGAGRPEDIDASIAKARTAAILESTGRKRWFGNATVSMDSKEQATFDALVLQQLLFQRTATGTVDVEKAVQAVAGQTGKFILVPGLDGTLQAVREPFKGLGRSLAFPLNEDPAHPLSLAKGYAPIYAPGAKIANAWGDEEDTLTTWAEDAKEAHRAFPGKVAEHDTLYLQRPNAAGLSMVRASNGAPVVFRPGEKVALRTGPSSIFDSLKGLETAEVPKDPEAAQNFFRDKLPPGWFAVAEGGAYVMYYGSRIKAGQKELDASIEHRGGLFRRYRDPGVVTELPGGAVVTYPNAPQRK
ncbi:hypothetical protein [Pseudorhodoferax sp.]|uniref:hypothetical protein n=1 Tax=Pseudorhodoferax sp. TaxID=1993553 RepID=UPI002DD6404B|nr:hypothetical protein [Pseudorhodoferax sp.]